MACFKYSAYVRIKTSVILRPSILREKTYRRNCFVRPLVIENHFNYEEITLVYPLDEGNGPEVGTSKALLFIDGIAIIYDNGHLVIDRVVPSHFFCGKCYEIAPCYQFEIADFSYSDELQVIASHDVADMISLMLVEC